MAFAHRMRVLSGKPLDRDYYSAGEESGRVGTYRMAYATEGPFVSIATFCDQVIEGKDGTISIIRAIDRWTITASGPEPPAKMPTQRLSLTAVIALKSGAAKGRQSVGIRPEAPSGIKLPRFDMPVLFEGEDRGANPIARFDLDVDEEGLYWFDVLLDDQLLTRLPLRVIYQPVQTGGTG